MKCVALFAPADVDRAVVGDDAEGAALDRRVAADRRAAVGGAELEEVGVVDEARDHLAHVDRALQVGRHHAEQLFRIEARRPMPARGAGAGIARPVEVRDDLARDARARRDRPRRGSRRAPRSCVCISGAAELLLGRDLAGRRHQQRRPGQEGARAVAHHHDVVGQAGLVGAARRRRAVRDGDDRQPGGRQAGQVAEQVAAADEVLDPVLHQVRAGALDQLHERQLVLERDLLDAQLLVEPHRLQRAGLDARIGRGHHAAHAGDEADAGDHAAARRRCARDRACRGRGRPASRARGTARRRRAARRGARAAAAGRAARSAGGPQPTPPRSAPRSRAPARAGPASRRGSPRRRNRRRRGSRRWTGMLCREGPAILTNRAHRPKIKAPGAVDPAAAPRHRSDPGRRGDSRKELRCST